MKEIFVNLKRFDVPKKLGGVCTMDNPKEWIEWVIEESERYGLGTLKDTEVTYLLPESLVLSAIEKLTNYPQSETATIHIGCQGIFREDVAPGGNFGAFTTNRPAAAVKNMGCTWAIIGHSEERKDKLGIIGRYDGGVLAEEQLRAKAKFAVDALINDEVMCAMNRGINVLFCLGETAEEKGEGNFEQQRPRIEAVLKSQLQTGLKGIENDHKGWKLVIGYEPIWAIGPGKTPPGAEYIGFVSAYIKKVVKEILGFDPAVVYGGGLKEENAETISEIESIDGGLVALTRFTGNIGFYPDELKKIIEKYQH